MRTLTVFERQIVKRICESKHENISAFFTLMIPDLVLELNRDSDTMMLKLKNGNQDEINEEAFSTTEKLVSIITFIKLLESEGYIYSCYLAHGRTAKGSISTQENFQKYRNSPETYVGWSFTDKEIQYLIYDYWDKIIIPTSALADYYNNGYLTEEQRRFRKSQLVAYTAIIVSVILGIFSFWMSYMSSRDSNTSNEKFMRLINTQSNTIIENQAKMIQQIDRLDSIIANKQLTIPNNK